MPGKHHLRGFKIAKKIGSPLRGSWTMVSIALVDARKTSLMGVQNSKKIGSPLRGSWTMLRIVVGSNPPLGKKLDPPLGKKCSGLDQSPTCFFLLSNSTGGGGGGGGAWPPCAPLLSYAYCVCVYCYLYNYCMLRIVNISCVLTTAHYHITLSCLSLPRSL